jgi:hypothetical protein
MNLHTLADLLCIATILAGLAVGLLGLLPLRAACCPASRLRVH